MSPIAADELQASEKRARQIRRESRERDREFSSEDRGFGYGFVFGIFAAGLALFLWFAHRHG